MYTSGHCTRGIRAEWGQCPGVSDSFMNLILYFYVHVQVSNSVASPIQHISSRLQNTDYQHACLLWLVYSGTSHSKYEDDSPNFPVN